MVTAREALAQSAEVLDLINAEMAGGSDAYADAALNVLAEAGYAVESRSTLPESAEIANKWLHRYAEEVEHTAAGYESLAIEMADDFRSMSPWLEWGHERIRPTDVYYRVTVKTRDEKECASCSAIGPATTQCEKD